MTSSPTPAPIDPAALRRTIAPFGASRTLPAEACVSQDVFDWEAANFFEGSWTCAGRSTDIPTPGDQTAVRVGSEGVLLTRAPGGELRGFYNVCRHRGHELLPCGERAHRMYVKCPYHAWVYDLDGSNKAAPRFGDLPGFDNSEFPLIPARVAEWHGWVFVNASGDAPPFEDHVRGLEGLLGRYEPERLVVGARHDYEIAANWKIVTENYHECYHCPSIHPELCQVTPPESGWNFQPEGAWVGGLMDLREHAETMSISGKSDGVPIRGLSPERLRQVLYIGIFPNLLISPHPDYVMTHRIEPIGPGKCRIECQWLFPPEAAEREGFSPAYAEEFWDITNREDWGACESVQRGMASRGYRPGPLSAGEDAVYQFQAMVARGYLEGRVSPAPHVAPLLKA